MSKAKVELWFDIDEEGYAKFYGENVNGETVQEALDEVYTLLRRVFQSDDDAARFRSSWWRASVGRPVPVEEEPSSEEHETNA